MYVGRHVKYPCQILMKIEFSRQIFEKSSNIKFMNSRSVGGGGFFHADRRTDRLNRTKSRVSPTRWEATVLFSKTVSVRAGTVAQFVLQSSSCHFKHKSKFAVTYGPKRPVADSAISPRSTAASRIRSVPAGACYIGSPPSLPRDHTISPTYSGSSRKPLLLLFSKPVHLGSFSHL